MGNHRDDSVRATLDLKKYPIIDRISRKVNNDLRTYRRIVWDHVRAASNIQLGEIPGAVAVATVNSQACSTRVHSDASLATREVDISVKE